MKSLDSALVWFRRDLRADDHAALYHALTQARQVWCAFVYDTEILNSLPPRDRRVTFIHESVGDLDRQLRALGSEHGCAETGLIVRHGSATQEIVKVAQQLGVQAVFFNHDDEPAALTRDAQVRQTLAERSIAVHSSKDHVVFERNEVLTGAGTPYSVFTPYKNAWLKKLDEFYVKAYPVARHAAALAAIPPALQSGLPALAQLGFEPMALSGLRPGSTGGQALLTDFLTGGLDRYYATRDFPALAGASFLGTHLRFGTLSVRQLAREAWHRAQAGSPGAQVWLSELCWRDFFHQILFHHPHVEQQAFRSEYDALQWETGARAEELFQAWCDGRTGYPLVDAGMRQLAQTGYMHNRLRMVTAAFLVKDLGIDWRRGERWFAQHLNDYDLAANNGNWQWAASTGCDAQPWFRIFNPVTQSKRFDLQGEFIRRYVPELAALPDTQIHSPWLALPLELELAGISLGRTYPFPVVAHEAARRSTLARFAEIKGPAPAEGKPPGRGARQ